MLASYEFIERIGRGTVGTVYRCRHRETGWLVAIKAVTGTASGADLSLEREIDAMARLNHPSVLFLLDHGIAGAGVPLPPGTAWLATEHATGGGLEVWDPADWKETEARFRAVLEGLRHAHSRGLVHRDLKPGNLLWCTPEDLRPGLKIADFGLAWATGIDEEGFRRCGTPAYMSPEQCRGAIRDLGAWSDLYALAAVVWQWLTGAPPFGWGLVEAILHAQQHDDVPGLKARFPVPDGLERLLLAMLEKRIENRPGTAARVLSALDGLGKLSGIRRAAVAPSLEDSINTVLDTPDTGSSESRSTRPSDRLTLPQAWHDTEVALSVPLAGVGLGLLRHRALRLVGRARAQDALWNVLRETVAHPRVRLVNLTGPSGVGASRLGRWVLERSRELGCAEGHFVDQSGLKATVLRGFGWVGERRGPIPVNPRDPEATTALLEAPEPTAARVGRWLVESARKGLVVVWVDDAAQSAERTELVRSLLFSRAEVPLLIVATGDPLPGDSTIELDPLTIEDLVELCERDLGLESSLAWRISERCSGNPGLLLDWVDDLLAKGALQSSAVGFVLREGQQLPVAPSSLASRLARPLEGLPEASVRHAALAALLGERFTEEELNALRAAVGDPEDPIVLRQLVRDGVLARTEIGFVFAHPQTRIALVDGLGSERPGLHLAAAAALARLPATLDRRLARGAHLMEAGQIARGRKVLFGLMDALREGRRFKDLAHAVRCARAGDRFEDLPDDAPLMAYHYALDAARHLGEYPNIVETCREGVRLALAQPEHPYADRLMSISAEIMMTRGALDDALEALQRCDMSVPSNIRLLGVLHMTKGDDERAEHFLGLAYERATRPHERGICANGLGMLAGGRKQWKQALIWFELCRDLIDPPQRHAVHSNIALVRLQQGDFAGALEDALLSTRHSRSGVARARSYSHLILALAAVGVRDDARLRMCSDRAMFYLLHFNTAYVDIVLACIDAVRPHATDRGLEFLDALEQRAREATFSA